MEDWADRVRDTLDEDKGDMPDLEDLREDLEEDLGVVEDFMGDYNGRQTHN